MNTKKIVSFLLMTVVVAAAGLSAQEVPELLKASNWAASWDIRSIRKPVKDFIFETETGLKLMGAHPSDSGKPGFQNDLQYALDQKLSAQFTNKALVMKFVFDGSFPRGEGENYKEGSYIAVSLRAGAIATSLRNQTGYAVIVREKAVQLAKIERGRNFSPPESFRFAYDYFPELGFTSLPIGQEVELSFAVIDEGTVPRLVVKINGIEIANVLDNKWGATIKPSNSNRVLICLQATNNKDANDLSPKSSITITSLSAE